MKEFLLILVITLLFAYFVGQLWYTNGKKDQRNIYMEEMLEVKFKLSETLILLKECKDANSL